MKEVRRFELPTQYRRLGPLTWIGNDLVDFGWGAIYHLDGAVSKGPGGFSYRFDRAVSSADGVYTVIYEQLGTKGLILKNGAIVREIDRSFYHAEDYEYPVAIFKWMDGQTAIAHCPKEYRRIEIESVETGRPLVSRRSIPLDIFHSQIQASSDGRYLLSAGWVWHPYDIISVYDLEAVAQRPEVLDEKWEVSSEVQICELSTAAFNDAGQVVIAGQDDNSDKVISIFLVCDLKSNTIISKVQLSETAGVLMPVGNYVVGFWQHPKLIDISTGHIVHRWNDINSGHRNGSTINDQEAKIQLVLDPLHKRFAIGSAEHITVVELG